MKAVQDDTTVDELQRVNCTELDEGTITGNEKICLLESATKYKPNYCDILLFQNLSF